jgi:chromosome segregation ATPase
MMSNNVGGRGRTATKAQLEKTQQLVQEAITGDKAIEPARQRLMSEQLTSLTKLYEMEQADRRDKLAEQIKSLQERVTSLETENAALKEKRAVTVSSQVDPYLQTQLDKVRTQLEGALQKINQLESELSTAKHNAEREVAALTREVEDLRSDANYGRQVKRERRIEELKQKVAEYDARLLLPNCGINPRMGKAQFDQLMATEKADRNELDELLGIKHKGPKKVPVHPDVAEHRAEQAQLSVQWNVAYTRGAAESVNLQPDLRSIPRMADGSVRLYGCEQAPEGWD